MQLSLEENMAVQYKNPSQKIRVLTEDWVHKEVYCPNCGGTSLNQYPNNKPVADFFCGSCAEDFELKSKSSSLGTKIVDGAYQTMLDRLADVHNPNFFLLNYDLSSYQVVNLFVIPKHFFVPAIIEKRSPLSKMAQRAGWIGCNILLGRIPEVGRIFLIKNRQVESKEKVRAVWQKTLFLRQEKKANERGWLLDIMKCIDGIGKKEFVLSQLYACERNLQIKHPENKHIKDKIRQQLQFLRDKGYLKFINRGKYRLV